MRGKLKVGLIGLVIGLASACASLDYGSTPGGDLNGQVIIMWVGEDNFVYWPHTRDPLSFGRPLHLLAT